LSSLQRQNRITEGASMPASPQNAPIKGSLPAALSVLLPFLVSQAYVVWLVATSDIDGFQAMVMYLPEIQLASFSSTFLFSRSYGVLAKRLLQFLGIVAGNFVLLVMLLFICTPEGGATSAAQQPGERMYAYAQQSLSGGLVVRSLIYLVISFVASLMQAFASADPPRTWYNNVVRPVFMAFMALFLSIFIFLTGGFGLGWPVVFLTANLSQTTRQWLGSLFLVSTFIVLRAVMTWFSGSRATDEQREQDYQAFLAGEG
jgi:hypothetical protein